MLPQRTGEDGGHKKSWNSRDAKTVDHEVWHYLFGMKDYMQIECVIGDLFERLMSKAISLGEGRVWMGQFGCLRSKFVQYLIGSSHKSQLQRVAPVIICVYSQSAKEGRAQGQGDANHVQIDRSAEQKTVAIYIGGKCFHRPPVHCSQRSNCSFVIIIPPLRWASYGAIDTQWIMTRQLPN